MKDQLRFEKGYGYIYIFSPGDLEKYVIQLYFQNSGSVSQQNLVQIEDSNGVSIFIFPYSDTKLAYLNTLFWQIEKYLAIDDLKYANPSFYRLFFDGNRNLIAYSSTYHSNFLLNSKTGSLLNVFNNFGLTAGLAQEDVLASITTMYPDTKQMNALCFYNATTGEFLRTMSDGIPQIPKTSPQNYDYSGILLQVTGPVNGFIYAPFFWATGISIYSNN